MKNITWNASKIAPEDRKGRAALVPGVLWMTGLSGAGKSTLANALDRKLYEYGVLSFVLDGDNLRHGLCSDLGFSESDRTENIRRAAELAKVLNSAGILVISSFISPLQKQRSAAKAIIGDKLFKEIFVKASVETCQQRDPKGLYAKVKVGEIKEFTGITAPYEPPSAADLSLDTESQNIELCVDQIFKFLQANHWLNKSV